MQQIIVLGTIFNYLHINYLDFIEKHFHICQQNRLVLLDIINNNAIKRGFILLE